MHEERKASRLAELAAQGALTLRRQIHDLFALFELPEQWRGREPREIAGSFLEVLVQLLRVDLAFIRLDDADGGIEHRFPPDLDGEALLAATRGGPGTAPFQFELPRPNSVGATTAHVIAVSPLGERGIVVVGSWRKNFPTAHEQQLLETAANQAALAMQSSREARAQRHLSEERSRLTRVNLALARLHAVSDGLSRAHTSAQVLAVVQSAGLAAVGAQVGSLLLVDETQSELRPVPGALPPEAPRRERRPLLVSADLPLAEAFRHRRARYVNLTERSSPERYGLPRSGVKAVAALPLVVNEHCLGMLSLGFDGPQAFSDDERALIQAIAQQTAQACDRARLLEIEQRARLEAEARQQRADFLSEASAALVSHQDFTEALTRLAHLVVPRFADWVMLRVSSHVSPALEETRTVIIHRDAARTGHAREYSRALLASSAEPRACITNNSVIAPITAREQSLGVVIFGADEPGRYGEETLALVEELGFRVGVAFENALLYKAAQEADRRKDEFLAMLGHELRNPLSPILTALRLMRHKAPQAVDRERTIIERQVEHMVRLVDDLLDVSRITRGKVQLKRGLIDMMSIVTKAVEMAAPLLEQRSHHLELVPPTEPLIIDGDNARLAQVVANLLSNAAKYTEPGGRIDVSVSRQGEQVALKVRDSGMGIGPEFLPHVFEVFAQDGRALDRAQGGLGLGLSIVRSLVELHGGTVSAHSEGAGRGSEFVVRLPLATARAEESSPRAQAGPRQASEADTSSSPRVLVVDDNQDAAEMLAEALGTAGFVTCTAFDGPSGLQAAGTFHPDVALLDIGLPVMDGYELAERLRATASLQDVKLIALTGYGQESDRQRAHRAGFDLHLVKPVDFDRLLEELQRITGASRAAHA